MNVKLQYFFIILTLLFFGCTQQTSLHVTDKIREKTTFEQLPAEFSDEDFQAVLELFRYNCQAKKTQKIYPKQCQEALQNDLDAKSFIISNFDPYKIYAQNKRREQGLLTGYYLASINGSKTPSDRFKYPIYAPPHDLVSVDLASIYPELKHYRLRGKVVDGKLVPYYPRSQQEHIDADVLCYCDSKIDRFFLEVQGSGVVHLDDNTTMYIGYADQNGHKYTSIGKYLIDIGAIKKEDVSLQSIQKWLKEHPKRVDEVLYQNNSMVFFKEKQKGAFGALGLRLTPLRSVAVDRRYTKLGSMLYLDADLPDDTHLSRIVFAQDTGGAIRGSLRADLFTGEDETSKELAGKLQSDLNLWIFLPKEKNE